MKPRFFYFFIFIFLVGTLASLVSFPLVSGACSLGASPLEMQAQARPGQIVEVAWNFFNLRGDRATHILVGKAEGPEWDIRYEPEAEIVEYEVAGILTEKEENFAIDKSEIVKSKPKGIYVVHPNASEGYIVIEEQLKILITLPDNAEIGKEEEFKFEAIGSCFGETGAVSASLATELKVKITPTTEYYEKKTGTCEICEKVSGWYSGENKGIAIAVTSTAILVIVLVGLIIWASKKKGRKRKANKKIRKIKRRASK